ncbi:tRNA methyltransferase ppm2 [Globodera pallida]|nr:tRNA methyltransferase ppm2 [Globodera pallida]
MGQTLSEPITTKDNASCSNDRYTVGSSSMQGWRISMEDAHTQLLELSEDPTAAFFAVFDGHGGAQIAKYASQNLHSLIAQSNAFNEGRISDSLVEGFLGLDEEMMTNDGIREEMSGSTAVVVLIKDNFIYCANAGDSRAVASVSGRAVALSTDHKPCNEEESRRIFAAGGWVEFNRVNGNLALSRAFGDFSFKKNESKSAREQIVTACPEVEIQAITPEHEFVLLACDGIWDVMTNQDAITFCRERLISGLVPEKICEELLEKCLAPDCELSGLGCDNMTAILVCLLQNYSLDDYLSQLRATAKPDELQQEAMERYSDAHQSSDSDEAVEDVFSTPSHSPRSSGPKEETNSETKEPNPDQAVENATPPPVERVQSKNSSSQRPQNDRAQQMDI